MDIQEQLAYLRQTVARTVEETNRRFAAPKPADFVEDLLSGEVVETPHGRHFEMEKLYARHQRHGSYEISDLQDWPHDLLDSLF